MSLVSPPSSNGWAIPLMSLRILLRIRGFVSLRYGTENSDLYQNVTDPGLWYTIYQTIGYRTRNKPLILYLPFYRCNTNGSFLCMYTASVRAASANYTMEQQLEECRVSLIGSPVPFADFPLVKPPLVFPLVKPPLVFPLVKPPLVFPLVELPPVLGLLSSMPKRSHWGLNTVREKNTRNFRLFLPERQITGRKIILMESNVKCRYLKNCPVKGLCGRSLICREAPSPPMTP